VVCLNVHRRTARISVGGSGCARGPLCFLSASPPPTASAEINDALASRRCLVFAGPEYGRCGLRRPYSKAVVVRATPSGIFTLRAAESSPLRSFSAAASLNSRSGLGILKSGRMLRRAVAPDYPRRRAQGHVGPTITSAGTDASPCYPPGPYQHYHLSRTQGSGGPPFFLLISSLYLLPDSPLKAPRLNPGLPLRLRSGEHEPRRPVRWRGGALDPPER